MKFIMTLTIITIILFCCVTYGQETAEINGSITGIVTDSESEIPILGAKVDVTMNGLYIGFSSMTDENGEFNIKNVPTGNLGLSVSRARYLPKTVSNVNVKEGKVTENVGIALQLITLIKVGDAERDFSLMSNSNKMLSLKDFKDKSIVVICVGNPYT